MDRAQEAAKYSYVQPESSDGRCRAGPVALRGCRERVVLETRAPPGFDSPPLADSAASIVPDRANPAAPGACIARVLSSALTAQMLRGDAGALLRRPALPGALDRRRLSRVLDYIAENIEGDLSIDRLALISCLSRFHFARAFKAAVGQTPHQYVSARRLEHAKLLLRRDDLSIVEVALTLKFSCQANFSRAFRKMTGQTPGSYRQQFV
jgi:AraC family transcriptional regulator